MELTLLFWIILSVTSGSWAKQRFDEEPLPVEVDPNARTRLVCKVQNLRGMCSWVKDGNVIGPIPDKYEFQPSPSDGDCSIRISNADIAYDDGIWQCQVSKTKLTEDPLLSRKVHLTVRNQPLPPYLEHSPGNQHSPIRMSNNDPVVTTADAELPLDCISQQGNPSATLRWFLGEEDVTEKAHQRNDSDPDKPKTWRAKSSLNFTYQKEHNGKKLKCIAYHPLRTAEVVVSISVRYKPTVSFIEQPPNDIKEEDHVRIGCTSDANPKANILWKTPQGIKSTDFLVFDKINRSDSGLYSCRASNEVGDSLDLDLDIEVKYPARVISVEPREMIKVDLFKPVDLRCEAEGKPDPRHSWLQNVEGQPNSWMHRGSNSVLRIQNVTYSFQGRYICEVSNVISQKEYKDRSFEIGLDVVGPPHPLTNSNEPNTVVYEKDEDAMISVIFCADPKPTEMFWEWGSNKLEMGTTMSRYMATPLLKDQIPDDCYQARLTIQKVESSDSRLYTLNVQNNKGQLLQGVELKVQEPVTMSAVIGIVVGCIVVLVVVVLVIFYLMKKEKCMLLRAKGFKPDASENSSRRLSEELTNGYPQKDRAIPPDALYTDVQESFDRESPSPGQPQRQSRGDGSVVYADLDLAALQADRPQGSKQGRPPARDRIEYAEIQFKPTTQRVDV